MHRHVVALVLTICCALGSAAAQDEEEPPINQWIFFDYDEERGWSNSNDQGEFIAIHECEVVSNKSSYRFFFTGLFEKYSDNAKTEYWLSGGHEGGNLGEIYVYTSKEYFDYLYSFSVDTKRALTDADLQFCARAIGDQPERCEIFSGTDFWKVVADLCVPVTAPEPELPNPSVGKATVVAFYLALRAGDGHAAAANVIPEKRIEGPLSAQALSDFYGNLRQPLRLLDVATVDANKFRARYTFETVNGRVCDGAAVVTTKRVDDVHLIAGIRAENGC